MGNLGLTELILLVGSLLFWGAGVAATVLGVVAFFKVRSLERQVAELQSRISALP